MRLQVHVGCVFSYAWIVTDWILAAEGSPAEEEGTSRGFGLLGKVGKVRSAPSDSNDFVARKIDRDIGPSGRIWLSYADGPGPLSRAAARIHCGNADVSAQIWLVAVSSTS